ncbi:Rpn family recombination-promoting nuclease/putative transposase, partial [Endothiovibrio diazotrophicus]
MLSDTTGHKHLFSHPELVRDLLEGFVHEEWVKELDFTTLERVTGSYVSDDLRERIDDMVWRVHLKERKDTGTPTVIARLSGNGKFV